MADQHFADNTLPPHITPLPASAATTALAAQTKRGRSPTSSYAAGASNADAPNSLLCTPAMDVNYPVDDGQIKKRRSDKPPFAPISPLSTRRHGSNSTYVVKQQHRYLGREHDSDDEEPPVTSTKSCHEDLSLYDRMWADQNPLYSRSSGVQKIGTSRGLGLDGSELHVVPNQDSDVVMTEGSSSSSSSTISPRPKVDTTLRRPSLQWDGTSPMIPFELATTPFSASTKLPSMDSIRNKDSVLHYFVATEENEASLDQYLSGIIDSFLSSSGPVHAATREDPNFTRSRFGRTSVPNSRLEGTTLEDYLNFIKVNVIENATRVSSSKMIGHMTSSLPYFHRPLARLLAALNQNVVKLETAATMTYLERETMAMMHREFFQKSQTFYDLHAHSFEHSLGVFTSGGTIANITAMWAARNRSLRANVNPSTGAVFRGIEKEGLVKALQHYGYQGAVIVGSAMMHYSFKKAADLLGLGDEGLCLIPTSDDFQMKVEDLSKALKDLHDRRILAIAVVGIAGTTETGSIDNLAQIGAVARHHNVHFHVDAAWGGPLIFSREHRRKLDGIQLADTITVDGHKQLYTPMGLGICLFQSPELAQHIRKTANYVIRHDSPDLGKFTLEGSRPATAMYLHATLHLLGRDGIESLVTRSATLVRQMAARLQSHPSRAFQTLHFPATNILLYRYIPSDLRDKVAARAPLEPHEDERIGDATKRVQGRQATEGENGFVSRTRVTKGGRWLDAFRVVIANPLTKWEDIEGVIMEQIKFGKVVEDEMAQDTRTWPREEVKMWEGWPFEL